MRIISNRIRGVVWAALLGLLGGCAGDSGVAPLYPEGRSLAGAWRGSEFSLTSHADSSFTLDLVALGGSMNLSITPSGTFAGTAVVPGAVFSQPGFVTVPLTGLVRPLDEDRLRIDFVPEVPPIFRAMAPAFSLDGHTLTLIDPESRIDFDGDGVDERALLVGVFTRS